MRTRSQGGVPRTVDVVQLARDQRGLDRLEGWVEGYSAGFTPQWWAQTPVGYGTVAKQAHVRHELLSRLDATGDRTIPAEIIITIFEYLGMALEDRMHGTYPKYHITFDDMNDLIEDVFSHFPSARLRRTAFEAFRKVMVFVRNDHCEEDVIDGIDAKAITTHFDDQLRNVVNLHFPVYLRYIPDVIDDPDREGITLQELLARPRNDREEALKLQHKMRHLRTVLVDIREFAHIGSTEDATSWFEDTRDEVKRLVEGEYAPMLTAFVAGLHALAGAGIKVHLQVSMYNGWEKTLSAVQLREEISVQETCKALLKPIEDGVQQTRERHAYEDAEQDRCMSD
ncbi:hypothetical protein CLAFUW4_10690 [Fulvia fulva]|uniref:Uncharacterized protein n=1 Tax=Passalora fulva TaxID=5499 RepID=A0A9Q8LFW3_PASFU|nr:uncharacterized protein CLAFUR5_05304 [Fulvia fulva]KAK4615760.1 hypothetical protein CLAFUR4_10695 [Fulvia fulva]KAK4617132.1 hypothetical protein CLAFUR0_10701 [Fulvia fulva]UJO16730.1 hypothetical protein CLAFUR5_05304 [Fulvia fulva]WPV18835.1 hypothetical protein CLAFUW4_10690 [Fulvia fulva]WPV33854.1 hypothetical protein CLAFUW7_10692 [Fulvia fulva]